MIAKMGIFVKNNADNNRNVKGLVIHKKHTRFMIVVINNVLMDAFYAKN
jgi:hypothetical protein